MHDGDDAEPAGDERVFDGDGDAEDEDEDGDDDGNDGVDDVRNEVVVIEWFDFASRSVLQGSSRNRIHLSLS